MLFYFVALKRPDLFEFLVRSFVLCAPKKKKNKEKNRYLSWISFRAYATMLF